MTTNCRTDAAGRGEHSRRADARDLPALAAPILEIDGRRYTGDLGALIEVGQRIEAGCTCGKHADTARAVTLRDRPAPAAPLAKDRLRSRYASRHLSATDTPTSTTSSTTTTTTTATSGLARNRDRYSKASRKENP